MKIEKKIVFKHEQDDKDYSFVCEEQAPLGAIWDALQAIRGVILQQMQLQQQEANPVAKEESQAEEAMEEKSE